MSTTCWWFFGHQWCKWELIVFEVRTWCGDGIENWQRRQCEKCGKYEERRLS